MREEDQRSNTRDNKEASMRFVIGVVLALSVGIGAYLGSAQAAGSAQAVGCMKASKLKSVFPPGGTAGFAGRDPLKVQDPTRGTNTLFCSAFGTTYYVRPGEAVEVTVALYKSAKFPLRWLAQTSGPVHRASNGARFKTYELADVAPAKDIDVVSAYRRISIFGTSISEAGTPVPIRAQLRLHRVLENAFARM